MNIHRVKERGMPPYYIWSGEQSSRQRPQRTRKQTWTDALVFLFDTTSGGDAAAGQHITDASGTIVFSMSVQRDAAVIRNLTGFDEAQEWV